MDVRIEADHVRYLRYDFPTATVHPTGTVTPAQIRDADRKTAPPEIRAILGETLFIPRAQGAELERFARRHAIAQTSGATFSNPSSTPSSSPST